MLLQGTGRRRLEPSSLQPVKTPVCQIAIETPLRRLFDYHIAEGVTPGARVRVLDRPAAGALPIRTEYRVLAGGDVSRLEVTLHTGRTHQIRAHLAHIGHPLLGDDKYGDRDFNREHHAKRLMLTATELTFDMESELAYLNAMQFRLSPKF